eukprot:4673323-Alexandrium_andersonii.AAC.1
MAPRLLPPPARPGHRRTSRARRRSSCPAARRPRQRGPRSSCLPRRPPGAQSAGAPARARPAASRRAPPLSTTSGWTCGPLAARAGHPRARCTSRARNRRTA